MFKNNKLKKYVSTLLALVIALSGFGVATFVYGSDDSPIAINSTNFPDKNWRTVVTNWYDGIDGSTPDGYLSQSEIEGITFISVPGMLEDTCGENSKITDLTGIEYFTSCIRLRCAGIGLESIDVSKMPQLVELTCMGNPLGTIDVSKNKNLKIFKCSNTDLSDIDLSNNTALTELDCYNNTLTQLDVSMLTNLTILRCEYNELSSIDLSKNTALTTLNCSNNHLKELDLANNTALTNVTDSFIGDQTTTAEAIIDNGYIFVEFPLTNASRIVSTSVDRIETSDSISVTVPGYNGTDFTPTDIDSIVDGIDYYYNTGLEDAENMNVHVDVERNFYQVKFYTDESKETLFSTTRVNAGDSIEAPEITDKPQCKNFDTWSEDLTNIQSDLDVYPIWYDDHDIQIQSFKDNIVSINCNNCGDKSAQYNFEDLVNAKSGTLRYVQVVDVNNDGIINAKDYAKLLKLFK
jgi:Leucine-rich repeat (LRR) protein